MVMGMANLAMVTGNIGRDGVGVNPLRGQNNVQGSCDMGSFPHEFPGYRHISDEDVRDIYEQLWGRTLDPDPGLRIPNMFDAALGGTFRGLYIQGEDIAQSDPNTQHVEAALRAMDLVVVQDLFLNETARFAHVFLPGTSFLEKDGTFTNAERRINRVRPVFASKVGMDEWEITCAIGRAMGYDDMSYATAVGDHGRGRRHHPDVRGGLVRRGSTRSARCSGRSSTPPRPARRSCTSAGSSAARASSSRRCTCRRPSARPASTRSSSPPAASSASTTSARRPGGRPTTPGTPRTSSRSTRPTPRCAASRPATWSTSPAGSGSTTLRASVSERMPAGVVYTTFHHPVTGANVVTTENSDWATNCPEYKVTAVEVGVANARGDAAIAETRAPADMHA